tara:strand:- start:668 stop:922 length:255 start_codon:yes stop_codon:yes gene_type:complete
VIKKQIISKKWGYLQIRLFEHINKQQSYDLFDLVITSTAWPYWRLAYKNLDDLTAKELYNVYKIRCWLLQFIPPRICYWLVIGK